MVSPQWGPPGASEPPAYLLDRQTWYSKEGVSSFFPVHPNTPLRKGGEAFMATKKKAPAKKAKKTAKKK
jgi:hypothetical protein